MKAHAILLLAALALAASCRPARPRLVPEISPPLMQEEVHAWQGAPAIPLLFPCAGGVGWIAADGRIVAWDPGKRKATEVFTLPFLPSAPPLLQNGLLLLQDAPADRLLVLDLAALEIRFASQGLGWGRILGVGDGAVVYLDGDRPAVRFWDRPQEAFRAARSDSGFLDCLVSPERILVLGRERLYVFRRAAGAFQDAALPAPASSPLCLDGDSLYYGAGRKLVKYSLSRGRREWQLTLGHDLRRRPLLFAGAVTITTDDHNVLRVNRRGSLLWWRSLGSGLSVDLQPMAENLAAVLLNREVRFVDPRSRTVVPFSGAFRPSSPPLAFGGYLYGIDCQDGACRLLRLGNRYGVDIEIEPAPARWLGRSLRFSVRTRNLVDPRWVCRVLDAQGQVVFSREERGADPVSLAWVPQQAGTFLIRVEAFGRNRDARGEAQVQVLDPLLVAPRFYLRF